MSPGRILVVLFWTKYAIPRDIKPGILKLTIRRGQSSFSIVFIFVSCEENGYCRVVSVGQFLPEKNYSMPPERVSAKTGIQTDSNCSENKTFTVNPHLKWNCYNSKICYFEPRILCGLDRQPTRSSKIRNLWKKKLFSSSYETSKTILKFKRLFVELLKTVLFKATTQTQTSWSSFSLILLLLFCWWETGNDIHIVDFHDTQLSSSTDTWLFQSRIPGSFMSFDMKSVLARHTSEKSEKLAYKPWTFWNVFSQVLLSESWGFCLKNFTISETGVGVYIPPARTPVGVTFSLVLFPFHSYP